MFERKKYKDFAKKQLKGRWTVPVLMTLCIFVIMELFSFPNYIRFFNNDFVNYINSLNSGNFDYQTYINFINDISYNSTSKTFASFSKVPSVMKPRPVST